MVLYFMGTGNSRYIAEKIAKTLEEPLFSLNDAIKNRKNDVISAVMPAP